MTRTWQEQLDLEQRLIARCRLDWANQIIEENGSVLSAAIAAKTHNGVLHRAIKLSRKKLGLEDKAEKALGPKSQPEKAGCLLLSDAAAVNARLRKNMRGSA